MSESGPSDVPIKASSATGGIQLPSVNLLYNVAGEQRGDAPAGAEVSTNAKFFC